MFVFPEPETLSQSPNRALFSIFYALTTQSPEFVLSSGLEFLDGRLTFGKL